MSTGCLCRSARPRTSVMSGGSGGKELIFRTILRGMQECINIH